MSLVRGLIQPGLSTVKKAPFYSAVDEALAAIKRPKGTGAEFYTELTKQPGVKKAELADRKLEQAFKAKGKITKEEAQQVLADNPPPQLSEQVYDITHRQYTDLLDKKRIENGYKSWLDVPDKKRWEWEEELNPRLAKHGAHKTHDGKNYREILLKLPSNAPKKEIFNVYDEGEALVGQGMWPPTERMQQIIANNPNYRVMREFVNDKSPNDYVSGHWEGEPNVLAHARVQDIDGPNGEKILQIEEIQSDWHQAGRKKGYVSDKLGPKVSDDEYKLGVELQNRQRRGEPLSQEELASLNDIMSRHSNSYSGGKIPDAPFKKNWHELTMKRLLNYAADNGYDSIAITPGVEQAKRYDLSKQLSRVDWDEDSKVLYGYDLNGRKAITKGRVEASDLPDYVGKEVAERLINTDRVPQFKGDTQGPRILSGLDLSVGGEGMKGFYDKMLPDYLNNFGKPYNAQVQLNAYQLDIPKEARTVPLHTFPITPEMRESIKQKGLPLYQQVGIPTVGTGAASQMVEQKAPEQEEPEYSKGGSIAKQAALAKLKQMRGEMAPRAEAVKSLIARDQNRYLADVVPNSLTNAEIEAEIQRMAARARASGQQEGVLPRAERDANLAKFLIESKVPTRAFHGPGRHSGVTDIDQFKTTESGTGGAWFASNPDYAAEFGDGYTMPVHLNMTNPVDLSKFGNRSLTVNQWMKAMQKAGVDTSEMQIKPARVLGGANKQGTPNYDLWELLWRADDGQNNIPEILKKQGFDGILAPAEYDSKTPNYVVFEPTQVKSALGNRGTFDPNEPDFRKATGGAIAKIAKKAIPIVRAPEIIKPSTLTELKKIVQQEKGGYGARRVERAADEVPNLESMYNLDALKERFLGDNAKALMTMSPADFEKFATELQGKTSVGPKAAESAKQGEITKYTVPTNEYVKHLERIAMFDSVPYLNLAKEEVGLPLLPYISGHEGRHRSRALASKGEKRNLVGITPTMDLREGLPRRSQEEFIEAMKKELELSGGLVLPQSEPMLGGRPPIILPDVYAKGGAVKPKVKDSKSGKVRITNSRDTMFMELSNKKLKRK